MRTPPVLSALMCSAIVCTTNLALAAPMPLPSHREIDIKVSNDNGAIYGSGAEDTYFINAPGGGLNQLHLTTDGSPAGVFGQVTTHNITTSSTSGTFWVSTTGGRGYNDDIILLVSVQGPISDDFRVSIKSSGYQWTPTAGAIGADIHYVDGAVKETFTKNDFLYGPQTTKPGPGAAPILPFYSGQNIHDPSTAAYLLFIDLYVGNTDNRASIDSGNVKVEFAISGLYDTTAAFNAYAWALTANIADSSINWTNRLSTNVLDGGQSGYSIHTTACRSLSEFTCLGKPVTTGCTVNGVLDQLCVGTSGNDIILGTHRDDVIVGLAGHDIILDWGGNDSICGGPDHDLLFGGRGNDALDGSTGNDALFGEAGDDVLNGCGGFDILHSGAGRADRCEGGEALVDCESVF